MSEQLFDPSEYRRLKLADFNGIGERIWPTSMWALHQGTDVLFYRNADAAKGISRAQHRLFNAISRMGDHPDAPGSMTVLVCTGLPGVTFDRQIAVFDHMHNDEKLRLARDGEITQYITEWFRIRERRHP